MVHGLNGNSGLSCTAGLWGATRCYLQGPHPGLGSDTITWTGPIYLVDFYNGDYNCDFYLSTNNNPHGNFWAPSCDGVLTQDNFPVSNSTSTNGTDGEPIEHIACVLSWQIYAAQSQYGRNVKIVAHSMGGLIVRYMIEQVQAGNSHFAPYLCVSDVVTFSIPHGGITTAQQSVNAFTCGFCYEDGEMERDLQSFHNSNFMNDLYNHDHPDAQYGYLTDWTMLGSLGQDPLDWDYQATLMSNSGGLSNNHRFGYDTPIKCNGQTEYSNGYDHSDYMGDQCDAYDAPYYYCDGCSRDKHTYFSYTTGAPHALHEMLLAFVYFNG